MDSMSGGSALEPTRLQPLNFKPARNALMPIHEQIINFMLVLIDAHGSQFILVAGLARFLDRLR